jgi:hypothetical protein
MSLCRAHPVLQRMIDFFFTFSDNVYLLWLSCNVKDSKQLSSFTEKIWNKHKFFSHPKCNNWNH